jgi:hypothetical protein
MAEKKHYGELFGMEKDEACIKLEQEMSDVENEYDAFEKRREIKNNQLLRTYIRSFDKDRGIND